jgi:hypothetical protein
VLETEGHTDDVLDVFPVVVDELVVGHGQELAVQIGEIESRRHLHEN